jgi:hypothetical protein
MIVVPGTAVTERPAAPHRAIAELAERAGWAIPAEVTVVVARARVRPVLTALSGDVLTDLDGTEPRLLIPGPFTPERRAMTEAALPGERIAVGVTVPLDEAADSFRWAVRALTLAEGGVIDGRVTLCEEHLLTLWLMADPRLIEELAEQRLAGLAGMPSAKQKALTETLRVWLESWSTAAEVGGRLHVHPQTVRYRLNQLKETMGDRFTDPGREVRAGARPAGDAPAGPRGTRWRRERPASDRRTPAAGPIQGVLRAPCGSYVHDVPSHGPAAACTGPPLGGPRQFVPTVTPVT